MFIHLLNEDNKRECIAVASIARVIAGPERTRTVKIAFNGGWLVEYQATYGTVLELIAGAKADEAVLRTGVGTIPEWATNLISHIMRPR